MFQCRTKIIDNQTSVLPIMTGDVIIKDVFGKAVVTAKKCLAIRI